VVGLQLKRCDIVGFDGKNNVYIIELKKRINSRNLKSTISQVNLYVKLFKETISLYKGE